MDQPNAADALEASAFDDEFSGDHDGADGASDEMSFDDDFADGGGVGGDEDLAVDSLEADGWDDGADAIDAAEGDGFEAGAWEAFEAEVADALAEEDSDEFLGRIMGGLSRVARGMGGAAGGGAQRGRRGGRGAPPAPAGGAGALGQAAQGLARLLGGGGGPAAGAGPMGGIGALLGQLMGQRADDFEAFDELADAYEDGVDEALPAIVGLAARGLARGLGHRSVGQLGNAARRALVRGVATATRTLVNTHGPRGARVAGRLSAAAGRAARRTAPGPRQAAQRAARTLPRVAQRVARQPARTVRRLAQPLSRGPRALPAPAAAGVRPRVGTAGPGSSPAAYPQRSRIAGGQVLRLHGPVDIVIRQR